MTEYDEKGKFFTSVVTKIPVRVVIKTALQKIEGEYYIRPNERLKDDLNQGDVFVALTNAKITSMEDQSITQCKFMLLNRNHIVWIIPEEEILPVTE